MSKRGDGSSPRGQHRSWTAPGPCVTGRYCDVLGSRDITWQAELKYPNLLVFTPFRHPCVRLLSSRRTNPYFSSFSTRDGSVSDNSINVTGAETVLRTTGPLDVTTIRPEKCTPLSLGSAEPEPRPVRDRQRCLMVAATTITSKAAAKMAAKTTAKEAITAKTAISTIPKRILPMIPGRRPEPFNRMTRGPVPRPLAL